MTVRYSIYSAAASLQQITVSIGPRYATQQVRVMGFADSRSDKGYNRELSERRAEAVKNYLVGTGKIDAARVSVEPMGESSNQWYLTPLPRAARKPSRRDCRAHPIIQSTLLFGYFKACSVPGRVFGILSR